MFDFVTLDGYFTGPRGEINWHNVDKEFNAFAVKQLKATDLLIFGRKTYELMAGYWPKNFAVKDDPIVARAMNTKPKIVFSKSLKKTGWNNTRLVKRNIVEEIMKLKRKRGKEIGVLGSADLSSTLIHHGLIDEFRIMVNPVAIGSGTPLFKKTKKQLRLKLIKTKTFRNGNVLLTYKPIKK
jgi:dihydrofolate reductase